MASPAEQDKTAVKLAIMRFRSKLVRQFREWAAYDPPGFRNFVLGTMKAALPKQRAGRKSNPVVIRAHELYLKRLRANRVNWDAIARVVIPEYKDAPAALQRSMRLALRAKTHSYHHSLKQTRRLSEKRKQFSTPTPC
jgi:hypothetical protein